MVCSLIGAFLLVYVAVITFMNILGYPLSKFMLDYQYPFFIYKKELSICFYYTIVCNVNSFTSWTYHCFYFTSFFDSSFMYFFKHLFIHCNAILLVFS